MGREIGTMASRARLLLAFACLSLMAMQGDSEEDASGQGVTMLEASSEAPIRMLSGDWAAGLDKATAQALPTFLELGEAGLNPQEDVESGKCQCKDDVESETFLQLAESEFTRRRKKDDEKKKDDEQKKDEDEEKKDEDEEKKDDEEKKKEGLSEKEEKEEQKEEKKEKKEGLSEKEEDEENQEDSDEIKNLIQGIATLKRELATMKNEIVKETENLGKL